MTGTFNDVGPYTMIRRNETIAFGNRKFILLLYGAYNAMGLIGSECNGIAVLDENLRLVVLDEHCKEASGYFGASERQTKEFDRLKALSADEFVAFCNAHPRLRQPVELQPKAKMERFDMREFVTMATDRKKYSKKKFLKMGLTVGRMVAARLGLNEDQYDVSINPGGPAVPGDVYLHTDTLYVNFGVSSLGPDMGFMYRSCKGRKDYTGGPNRWMKYETLLDMDKAIAAFKRA